VEAEGGTIVAQSTCLSPVGTALAVSWAVYFGLQEIIKVKESIMAYTENQGNQKNKQKQQGDQETSRQQAAGQQEGNQGNQGQKGDQDSTQGVQGRQTDADKEE
jgi:hypothetical protein